MPAPQAAESIFPRIAPNTALVLASMVALSACFVSVWIAMHQPWLGISLTGNERGLEVVEVADNGPSANILSVGDVIVKMAGPDGNFFRLQAQDIIEDPDTIPTLKERDAFRARQDRIYNILLQPVVALTLEDGRALRIQPSDSRPLRSSPVSFWVLSLFGFSALLVGTAIWAVNQRSVPTRYLLISGLGTTCLLNSINVIASRELALEGELYPWLALFYHLGNDLFVLGMLGLLWNYPRSLGRFPFIPLLIVFTAFFILNENLMRMELPGNSVLIQVPVYWVLSVILMVAQWIRSRGRLMDRVAIKAIIMLVTFVLLILATSYFAPLFISGAPKVSLLAGISSLFIFYVMLAVAVQRYQLFNIDRWWAEIWLWFFAGVAIIGVDLVLTSAVSMAPSYALGLSIITIGWLYFPVRQWIWAKLFHQKSHNLEEYVPLLLSHFMREDYADSTQLWKQVLDNVFRPLAIVLRQESVPGAMIPDKGLKLRIPCLDQECSFDLEYADKGSRLFNSYDVKLAQALFGILKQAAGQREGYLQGMMDERKRIMRDLHDDIGGRLLTLTHMEHGSSQTASEALKRLREIIYSLDAEQQLTINILVAKLRIEMLERCDLSGVGFEWRWEEPESDIVLTPRQVLNLTLIFREALTNALKQRQIKHVSFDLHVSGAVLDVRIENDGLEANPEPRKPGKGLRNMQARVEELGGKFDYACGDGTFCMRFSVPMGTSSGAYDA